MRWSWAAVLAVLVIVVAVARAEVSHQRRPRFARVNGDIETVWQRPVGGTPRGIFFMAHGCNHQATDFFTDVGHDGWRFEECATSSFGKCLGLPEELKIRDAARHRGYIFVAVSGTGYNRCWDADNDLGRVVAAIAHVKEAEGLHKEAPVLASGASSGGALMGALASIDGLDPLQCIVPQIMGLGRYKAKNRGIPTLFVHMPRDTRTMASVQSDIAALQRKKIRTAEIRAQPMQITSNFLAPCVSNDVGNNIVDILTKNGIIVDGYLREDARSRAWVSPVREMITNKISDTLVADESCLAELMNVAWAKHEMTAQHVEGMFDFCEDEEKNEL